MTISTTSLVFSVNPENCFSDLLKIAEEFPENTAFVPCVGNSKGKKVPVKGCNEWQSKQYTKDKLSEFARMTMLAIVLDDYLAIDCDGLSAIEKLNDLKFELTETLIISSNPGYRQAYIYRINRPLEYYSINTGTKEQLEFRTGDQYQVIAGIHPTTNQPYYTNNLPIADLPDCVYKFLERESNKQYLEEFPYLEFFLTPTDRSKINSGVNNNRNDEGIKLALNLIGTENRLNELKIKFQNTAEDLFYQYCLACDQTDWHESEWQTIYKSALSRNPQPCYEDDHLLELSKAWNCEQTLDQNIVKVEENLKLFQFGKLQEKIKFYKSEPLDSDEILIKANQIFYEIFSKNPGYSDKKILDYIVEKLADDEISDSQKQLNFKALDSIKKAEESKLDSSWILQDISILPHLEEYAINNNIPLENLVLSLLVVCSSLFSKKLFYNFNSTGLTHANLFLLFTGTPTAGKSMSVDPVAKPLEDLAKESNNEFKRDDEIYNQELEDWRKLTKAEKEARYLQVSGLYELPSDITPTKMRDAVIPKPVEKNPYLLADASFEAVVKKSGEHNKFGLLIAPDEIVDFIKGIDRINKSKSGALNQFIAVWNGAATTRTRASLKTEMADYFRCSILSTIQTKRFYELFDINDDSGIFSRFLYLPINDPIRPPNKLLENGEVFDLPEILKNWYRLIQSRVNPESRLIVKPTVKAHAYWGEYRNQLEERSDAIIETNPGFSQWLARQPIQVARIALTIHVIRCAEGLEDVERLSESTMLRAIMVSRFFTDKASIIFGQTISKGTELLDQSKINLFSEFLKVTEKIRAKNNTDVVKVSDLATHSFVRKAKIIEIYGIDKNQKYLKKPEILKFFKDFSRNGIAEYEDGVLKF